VGKAWKGDAGISKAAPSSAVARAMGTGAVVMVNSSKSDRGKRDFTFPPQCAMILSFGARRGKSSEN